MGVLPNGWRLAYRCTKITLLLGASRNHALTSSIVQRTKCIQPLWKTICCNRGVTNHSTHRRGSSNRHVSSSMDIMRRTGTLNTWPYSLHLMPSKRVTLPTTIATHPMVSSKPCCRCISRPWAVVSRAKSWTTNPSVPSPDFFRLCKPHG